jgi:5-methyltetrahydropteroyltriglutamate--homocysteine methyltransferase
MKRSTDRILTTHVGSLIRPPALREFLAAKEAGQPFDKGAYAKCRLCCKTILPVRARKID